MDEIIIQRNNKALEKITSQINRDENLSQIIQMVAGMTKKERKKLVPFAMRVFTVKNKQYRNIDFEKFQYEKRIYEVWEKYSNQLNEIYGVGADCHDVLVHFRNEINTVFDEMYSDILLQSKGIGIRASKRKYRDTFDYLGVTTNLKNKCAICGESRTTNRCHIIPHAEGGADYDENMVILCPTHHFLFDQNQLSKEEFEKISVDGKADDSVQYFNTVRRADHERYWETQ